jgi:hypothetical protein
MTAAETIARNGIAGTAAQAIARNHGARLARQFVESSRIGAMVRQLERAQRLAIRRRDWMAAIEAAKTGSDLQRLMVWIHAMTRVKCRADELAEARTEARAQRRHCPPRPSQHPVRTRRCSRAPNDVSSLPLCPGVAA